MAKKRNRVRIPGTFVAVLPLADHNIGAIAATGDTIDVIPDSDAEPETPDAGAANSVQAVSSLTAAKSLSPDGTTNPDGASDFDTGFIGAFVPLKAANGAEAADK